LVRNPVGILGCREHAAATAGHPARDGDCEKIRLEILPPTGA